MSLPARNPSRRFLRAAASERDDLLAHRQQLRHEHARLLADADRVAEQIAEADAQLGALTRIVGEQDATTEPAKPSAELSIDEGAVSAARLLSGNAVRETAVRVLLEQPEYIEAIHYRQWYDLVIGAGYAIKGKDPHAAFLTHVRSSPVVRKSSQPGIYEIDRQVPLRLRQRFERLQADLRDLAAAPPDGGAAANAARRRELTVAIDKTEKELEEALRVLRKNRMEDEASPVLAPGARLSA